MLREKNLIDGIGARIARSIPWLSSKAVPTDRFPTSVTSANQKKTTTTVKREDVTSSLKYSIPKSSLLPKPTCFFENARRRHLVGSNFSYPR